MPNEELYWLNLEVDELDREVPEMCPRSENQ